MSGCTVSRVSEGFFKDRGSRFIAVLYRVDSVEEVHSRLAELRKAYHDARHVCYAYRIDHEVRENDDGEPSHSAGAPIMRQLVSHDLNHIACFVVRYFGGTKLGVPGLIQAYGKATEEAIGANETVPFYHLTTIYIECGYPHVSKVKQLAQQFGMEELESEYAAACAFKFRLRQDDAPLVAPLLEEIVDKIERL